jgi:hypothetical protein
MPVSVANNLPVRCFLSDPKRWKSLDPVLPAGFVTGYSAMAGRLYTTLTIVLILLPVISIAKDQALKKHLCGKLSATDINVKKAVTAWLQILDTNFF